MTALLMILLVMLTASVCAAKDSVWFHRDSASLSGESTCYPPRPYPQPAESLSTYEQRLSDWMAICRRIEHAATLRRPTIN